MKTLLIFISFMIATQSFAQSTTEAQIKALSQKRVNWLIAGNLDSLKNLYDANSITIHGNGIMIRSREDHLADIKAGRPVYKTIEIKESQVNDFRDTAVLVGKGLFNIAMNGQDMNYTMTYTEVYKKEQGGWKLIARQAVEQK